MESTHETPHPYVRRIFDTLGERDPIQVLEASPAGLELLLEHLSEDDLETSYRPGGWTVREILAHLADVELGLGFRFRQALTVPRYRPEGFDQDRWSERYGRLEPSLAVEAFRSLRAWNLALFATFDLDDWLREVDYPFAGIETVDHMVRFLAGHDLNHLRQLGSVSGLPLGV
jgi:hypothetical protein